MNDHDRSTLTTEDRPTRPDRTTDPTAHPPAHPAGRPTYRPDRPSARQPNRPTDPPTDAVDGRPLAQATPTAGGPAPSTSTQAFCQGGDALCSASARCEEPPRHMGCQGSTLQAVRKTWKSTQTLPTSPSGPPNSASPLCTLRASVGTPCREHLSSDTVRTFAESPEIGPVRWRRRRQPNGC